MNRTVLLIACTLPLAACNQGPEVSAKNATAEEVADKVADAGGTGNFVRPGKWSAKITIEDMSMPGMPPEAKAHMQGIIGRTDGHESCLTEEEAKRPKEDFFAGSDKNCRYDHFNMGGGKIDAAMKCSENGSTQTMTMTGTYSPDTYAMRMSMQGDGRGMEGMSMKMRVDAKRIGACDGKEA